MRKKSLEDIDVEGKNVLVRVDYNVPLDKHGRVADDRRVKGSIPTIRYLLDRGCKVILISHLGRPKGKLVKSFRLKPAGRCLSQLMDIPVRCLPECVGDKVRKAVEKSSESVILLENLRFHPGERENSPVFAQELASLADIYVNDAFATAHRAHASTVGVPKLLPSVMGLLMEKELETLGSLLTEPPHPFIAILGGNKVSDKLGVIEGLINVVDTILIGGGMCFTFLKVTGIEIGHSVYEKEQEGETLGALKEAREKNIKLVVPVDFTVADRFDKDANTKVVPYTMIPPDWMGLDIGPSTVEKYREIILEAATIFWNGPMGVFEWEPFSLGTKGVAQAIADSRGTSVVGGGDSDAALHQFGLEEEMTFISTGGGACVRLLEGKNLPGVDALENQ